MDRSFPCSGPPPTINDLCDRAQAWADTYYQKVGRGGVRRPTREACCIRDSLKALRAVAGSQPISVISADTLYACQSWMIERGLARSLINARIRRIRRVLRWAAQPPRRWISAQVIADLSLVDPLKIGRTEAKESEDIASVSWEMVSDTISRADLQLATMIELQWHTGMRPCELVGMRRSELEEHVDLMLYRPREHKTQHYDKERLIWIGPEGQAVLRPWLARLPAEMDRLWSLKLATSYTHAIQKINRKHGLKHWYPLQIRHAFATRMDRIGPQGRKAAQVLLGHAHLQTTSIYIDPDMQRAMDLIRKFG